MLSALAVILLGLVAAVSRTTPDFTGRWVLRSSVVAPDTARVLVVEQSAGDDRIRIVRISRWTTGT
ncbi:MAG TPA: hypothetical protein VFK57_07710 [Vicinamibacterales bacterium]|nr:hypothetical protein [Vicinamibacterales bacterium]